MLFASTCGMWLPARIVLRQFSALWAAEMVRRVASFALRHVPCQNGTHSHCSCVRLADVRIMLDQITNRLPRPCSTRTLRADSAVAAARGVALSSRATRALFILAWLAIPNFPTALAQAQSSDEQGAISDQESGRPAPIKRVAAIVTEYRHNSHADVIVSRLLLTDTLDGKGKEPRLKLASLYTDQRPSNDTSRLLAASHRFPIYDTIAGALTLGTGKLAVDGVLLIAEHGDYPYSSTGNHQYPKRRFWDETIAVFRASGRVVPVFVDKHLADNWKDAKHLFDTAREMQIPLMAGSSVPGTWRHPPADVESGARIDRIVAITYGSTDAYGFHALEAVQSLAEQRAGGETGIRSVQMLSGDDVWSAKRQQQFDPAMFQAAWDRLPDRREDAPLEELAKDPKLMIVEYNDGLRLDLFELNGAASGWSAAWRYASDGRIESTQFWTQEARPGYHFQLLLNGIERMVYSGRPSWNAERTLLTSGALDALLQSHVADSTKIHTPYLDVAYEPIWRWQKPSPPPPGRPWSEQ